MPLSSFSRTIQALAIPGLFFVLCIGIAIAGFVLFSQHKPGKLTVAFLDVGQGDAIYIESPTGIQLVVDGGPNRAILGELASLMPFFDRTIDAIVVTNPDLDHFGGFIDVLARYRVLAFIDPGVEKNSGAWEELQRAVMKEGADTIVARRGHIIDIGGGATIEILFPDRDVSGVEPNTGSIVMRLRYSDTSVLLMGDSVKSVEEYIVSLDGSRLKSDILKIGHHGSRTSTGLALLAAALPAVAVISAGADNRYGHPHREVLDTLAQFKVETLLTAHEKTVIFKSDGRSFVRIK